MEARLEAGAGEQRAVSASCHGIEWWGGCGSDKGETDADAFSLLFVRFLSVRLMVDCSVYVWVKILYQVHSTPLYCQRPFNPEFGPPGTRVQEG